MIVFRGKGGFVFLFAAISMGIVWVVTAIFDIYVSDVSSFGGTYILAGVLTWFSGRRWNHQEDLWQQGQKNVVYHTFFWIKMEYWALVYVLVGILIFIFS